MVNKVKIVRLSRKMSQEKLAREIDISLNQMKNIENERSIPSVFTALKIKKALRCITIEELFDID
jgi:DNA-binding XRE family transcriptional regulator